MALRVRQLNGDTTFLLTFTPPFCPETTASRFPGDFTILIDPWLSGSSSVLHPSFQTSNHVQEPAVKSLKEIEEQLNLIIISQDKTDHCHRETLCTLTSKSKVDILATAAAAKKIRSWNYFDPNQIRVMKHYDPSITDSLVRIPLPGYGSPNSGPGSITIAYMPMKRDVTGLHNAIGITYQPPSSIFTLNPQEGRYSGATTQLSAKGMSPPSTPPQRPKTSNGAQLHPSPFTSRNKRDRPALSSWDLTRSVPNLGFSSRPNLEKTLSILYTPHGVHPQLIQPYISQHLTPLGALPALALFHSMTTETNPWFMGGTVSNGAPGGVKLSKALSGAQHWISAHDAEKENIGLATKWCRTYSYDIGQVNNMLAEAGLGETTVLRLGVGEHVRLPIKREGTLKVNGAKMQSMPNLPYPQRHPPLPQANLG